jgi:hypothetical protein
MKNHEINASRFFLSLVLAVAVFCLTWAGFANAQGDPVRCKKLQAIGERLQMELEVLRSNLNSPEHPECLGGGEVDCQKKIKDKQLQVEANRRLTELACADLPTPTPQPTPRVPPLCKRLQVIGERLGMELAVLRSRLNNPDHPECLGGGETDCRKKIKDKQAQIEANRRQTEAACGQPTPAPTPTPTPGFWIPVGPAPEDASGFGVGGGVSGRVWTIAVSPNFDHRGTAAMYIGVAGGGVWRSTDFLRVIPHWIPLTDHFPPSIPLARQVGLQNIGALGVDPNNPWIIYAGSGDPDPYSGGNAYGQGLLKSTDGGNTWRLLSLGPNPSTPGFARILVDPTDHSGSTLYVAGGLGPNSPLRGIFKSNDGGNSWSNIQNGMPSKLAITDIDYAVNGDKLTLFAGVNDLTGKAGGVNGIWQSTDGGNSWSQMFIFPLVDRKGRTTTTPMIGLIKLAIDHMSGSPHGAFAAVSDNRTSAELINVFRLEQGIWKPTGIGIQGNISTHAALAIGISELGAVYVGLGGDTTSTDGIYQSLNGGASWVSIHPGANNTKPHHDQRCWGFFAGRVFEGNDGGISRFIPASGQAAPGTWESLNTPGLQTILAEGLGLHPQYPNVMLVGSQDNAVAIRNNGVWRFIDGEDERNPQFDPYDARFLYHSKRSSENFFFRSDDDGLTWASKSPPAVEQDYAPFAFHPTTPGRMALGTDRVYETRNRGAINGHLLADSASNRGQ